jgi:transposase-like protein
MVDKKQAIVPTLGYTKRMNFFITLFWPSKKILWNAFKKRRNIEFRKHLSNLVAYAKRHNLKRIILFVDRATYHKTPAVKKFLKEHRDILTVKRLGKSDPNSNPLECLVNKRLSSAVCVDRSHDSIDAMTKSARRFLRKYNLIYVT